jgi:hypothetical protein
MTRQRAVEDWKPPQWTESLLRVLVPSRDRDRVAGDRLEEYYLTGAPFKIFVPSVIGATTGLIGGLFATVGRHAARSMPQE